MKPSNYFFPNRWRDKCAHQEGFDADLASVNNAREQKLLEAVLRISKITVEQAQTIMRMDMKNLTVVYNNEKKRISYS